VRTLGKPEVIKPAHAIDKSQVSLQALVVAFQDTVSRPPADANERLLPEAHYSRITSTLLSHVESGCGPSIGPI
jgi:hypothetical protein